MKKRWSPVNPSRTGAALPPSDRWLRFPWPAGVARYLSCAFHRDHRRAAVRHSSLQYRWRACWG
jgi:hypothetical protein